MFRFNKIKKFPTNASRKNALQYADALLEWQYVSLSPAQLFSTSMLPAENNKTKNEKK